MTEVFKKDAGGATLKLLDHNGKLRCSYFPKEKIEAVPDLVLQEYDIVLCSFPKSGCHWLWEIARMLQMGSTTERAEDNKLAYMFELVSQEQMDQKPSPRMWNTHLKFSELPKNILKKKNKIIFVYRNPKDAALSFYNMQTDLYQYYEYEGKFNDYLELYNNGYIDWGSIYEYLVEWDQAIKTHSDTTMQFHVISYEDAKRDTMREIKRLCEFLGKDYDQSFLESVQEACTMSKMRARKGQGWELPSGKNVIYRKGLIGDWKNHFSVARSEEMDRLMREKLSGVQFKFENMN